MKLLKIPLGDGKVYTISTFSIKQSIAFKKEFEQYKDMETEINKIMFELTPEGKFKLDENKKWVRKELSKEEQQKIDAINENVMNFGISVLRRGLAKLHKEFAIDNDPIKNKEIDEKVGDIVDLQDLRDIIQFCFNGVFIQEERVIEIKLSVPLEGGDAAK